MVSIEVGCGVWGAGVRIALSADQDFIEIKKRPAQGWSFTKNTLFSHVGGTHLRVPKLAAGLLLK
jgi:hypothetical protein